MLAFIQGARMMSGVRSATSKIGHLGPRVVLPQLPAVIAEGDDGGRLCQLELLELVQQLPDVEILTGTR